MGGIVVRRQRYWQPLRPGPCDLNLLLTSSRCIVIQCTCGGHLDVVRELLDHGANVPISLVSFPLIEPSVTEMIGTHLVMYVIHLLCCFVNHAGNVQFTVLSAFCYLGGHFCQSVNSRALFAIRVICRMVLLAKFSELVWRT